jgi:hypothetical protein
LCATSEYSDDWIEVLFGRDCQDSGQLRDAVPVDAVFLIASVFVRPVLVFSRAMEIFSQV